MYGFDYTTIQYATHRIVLHLEPGVAYGVTMWSSDYAMRLYIDGEEVGSVGTPGAAREETTPRTVEVTYYFVAQSDSTEFVAQSANWVHKEGAWAPILTIGTTQNITRLNSLANMKSGIIFGGLVVAGLYHLAIFLLNRRQKTSLLFAALCLLLALLPDGIVTLAFPNYNWQVVFRLGYIATVLALAVLVGLIEKLFPGALHRPVLWGYLAVCGAYSAVVLFTNTVFFSQMLVVFQILSAIMGSYVLVRLVFAPRPWGAKKVLALVGIGAVGLFSLNNMLYKNGIDWMGMDIGRAFNATTGMLVFVFCYILVLSLEQAEVNRRLEDARLALAEAEARYTGLLEQAREKVNRNGQAPAPRLADLGLTKRETEVALLLLNGKSRDEITELLCISRGTVNYHLNNIYRKAGVSSANEFSGLIRKNGDGEEKSEK